MDNIQIIILFSRVDNQSPIFNSYLKVDHGVPYQPHILKQIAFFNLTFKSSSLVTFFNLTFESMSPIGFLNLTYKPTHQLPYSTSHLRAGHRMTFFFQKVWTKEQIPFPSTFLIANYWLHLFISCQRTDHQLVLPAAQLRTDHQWPILHLTNYHFQSHIIVLVTNYPFQPHFLHQLGAILTT